VNYVYSSPGSYEVALTITSNQGCSATGTLAQDIEVYPYPDANFTWEPLPPNILENEIQFINQTSLGSTFEWDFGILGSSNLPNPTITLPLVDQGFYPVCLVATSIYGCTDTICNIVDIESILLLYVPTAFTPDGDGINDVFYPVVSGISRDDYTFRIFDRWGNLVFESNDIDEPWLGNYDGGEHYVQNDVFVWQMKCKLLESGDNKEYFGRVTLVR
jgi:gliding motility-associated-like protein